MKFGDSHNFVSIHSRLKAAGKAGADTLLGNIVSIHSRLKAAAWFPFFGFKFNSFNTQPPEGGCLLQVD